MKKHLTLAAIAAISVGSFAFVPAVHAGDTVDNNGQLKTTPDSTPGNGQNARITNTTVDNSQIQNNTLSNPTTNPTDYKSPAVSNTGNSMSSNTADTSGTARTAGADMSATSGGANAMMGAPVDQADSQGIRDTLARTVEAATTKDNFDNLVNNLSKADRERIGSASNQNWSDLNGKIDQFQKDWKDKYGQPFRLNGKESVVFAEPSVHILQAGGAGTVGDNARTAGSLMGPDSPTVNKNDLGPSHEAPTNTKDLNRDNNVTASGSMARGGDVRNPDTLNDIGRVDTNGRLVDPGHGKDTAAARQLGQPHVDNETAAADRLQQNAANQANWNAEHPDKANEAIVARDRAAANDLSDKAVNKKEATVAIPGAGASMPTTLTMVNEGAAIPAWRINAPDSLTGQQLHDRLLANLTKLDDNKAGWPNDVTEASRAASHEILAAIGSEGSPVAPNVNPGMTPGQSSPNSNTGDNVNR